MPQDTPAADLSHAAIAVNLDACIQCTRCLRACRDEQVNDVIGLAFRGDSAKIVFDMDDPMGASTCVACGECVQACPTGALMPARDAALAVPDKQVESVSPIIRFKDIDQAIAISNGTAYGLSSAVCTNRMDYITRFINELQVGSVNVREVPGYRLELTPFGGIKDSGLGYKEGVQEAMKSFTNLKTYSLPWL